MSRGGPTKDWAIDCKVYIGDLGYGAAKEELEEKFSRFGTLRNVWVARNPPGFAFVEFQDPRDAEDATRSLDGTRINNRRVRVEMSVEKTRRGPRGPPSRRPGPPRRDGGYNRGPPRRGSYGRSPSPRKRSRSPAYRSRSRSPKGRDWNRERDRPRFFDRK